MIQLLATKYSRHIAYYLFLLFISGLAPAYSSPLKEYSRAISGNYLYNIIKNKPVANPVINTKEEVKAIAHTPVIEMENDDFIGGPSQPEMSSFKSVGTDNMVNLFTGDFSYNIPLLDVGGYPVNIFYNGGITPEQEASWVGLGWNINPGTVSRNMRGVPDDFDGTDILTQFQMMKPNKTWGVNVGGDLELVGVKDFAAFSGSVGATIGVSYNNYLGPALELGIKGTTSFSIANKTNAEKNAYSPRISAGLSANLSSRNGLTLSPNVSLTASSNRVDRNSSFGIGLSTSYNSRTGIKSLQINEQMSFSNQKAKECGITMPLFSTSLSFTRPSYIPSVRMPVTNSAFAGRFQYGGGIFGVYGSLETEVYIQGAEIKTNDALQKKQLVGYLYYQKANTNSNAVMDFTRFNDAEVTPNTSIISAPQYSYDVFSIQGEGTGGSIRAYRNDMGYVRDNNTKSQDKSFSAGVDIGPPGHYGGNFNTVKTPSYIGEWVYGNKLKGQVQFTDAKDTTENVYFRNPAETSVLNADQFDKIAGTDLVRFRLGGTTNFPTIEPELERFSKTNVPIGTKNILTTTQQGLRKKRTQVTSYLTAGEASLIGLDKKIKSYRSDILLDGSGNLIYDAIDRISDYRKKHHISEITVTETDGKRYVYGIPAYNVIQKDFTFTVSNPEVGEDMVNISSTELSSFMPGSKKDDFLQRTETPGYAHSFLLSGLLSPDYVDVGGDGITEDDLGNAVKFNYTRTADHTWRTPLSAGGNIANFNGGKQSENKDDKGIISFGKRESWYLHSLESKTMIALFTLEDRNDGKGPVDEVSGVNGSETSLKRLKKIDLYNKSDLKKNGVSNARPIKTVWFVYSYILSNGTPDNLTGGKLTLDSIYFTFNGKSRVNKNKYAFYYNAGANGNLNYRYNSSDRWGNFKPSRRNPPGMKNSDYPYALQDKAMKDSIDYFASAWSLKKILLPSGAQLEVEYESDDYAFVQNKRATDMMEITGVGPNATTITNKLYGINSSGYSEYDYVFIKVPEACANRAEVFQKYLQGVNQLAFKIAVVMPKGTEFVKSYATIEDYNVYDATRIWIKLKRVDEAVNGLSPLSLTALEYLREQLPGQAFEGYDVSESTGLQQAGEILIGMLQGLRNAFKNPVNALRGDGKAQFFVPAKSFVRLNDPDGYKYGGGQRVKSVRLKDNWKTMTKQFTSEYGQVYDYCTKEMFNGVERKISSGVASYEPTIGGEENPFQTIVQVSNKLPLGPTSYGAIEMPVLDAFFPAPVVGYSKVTVKSLQKGTTDPTKKSRSGIGKQVTEFYTAKDYPVYYNHTGLDPKSDKQTHVASTTAFFYKYAFDSRALSQGFIVEINDMHGKMKSQASYAENDTNTRIGYTENFYRNTGSKGLNDKFDFVYQSKAGAIEEGNMGIDVELMTDTREFSVKGSSFEVQGQVDLFPLLAPIWLPFIWIVSGNSENTYRAVTTTKVVNYHSIVDSVVVIDKGSQVSTKNLVYDAETGHVIVTRTNNEFDKPVYSISYPAWWAYSNMALAYKNIDVIYNGVQFRDGKITAGIPSADVNRIFESGDELFLVYPGDVPADNCASQFVSINADKLWAFDKNKTITALTNTNPDFVFMDSTGHLYTKDNVSLRIIRSGHRNILNQNAATVSLMGNPIQGTTSRRLAVDAASKVISAGALEFREKWQTDNDVIRKVRQVLDPATCTYKDVIDCIAGDWEKSINPYRKGLLTVSKNYRSLVFYENRAETDPTVLTNLPQNGFLSNFKLYWDFNPSSNLVPDAASTKWVWNNQITRINSKGLELETKDALNIYTAAQYGFNKTAPVAITSNARYDEMVNEGFEDFGYNESINNVVSNVCAKRHLDFTGVTNAQVINTDSYSFNAHTGKYVMGINPFATATKQIPVISNNDDKSNYSFTFAKDTIRQLYQPGGNIDAVSTTPYKISDQFPDSKSYITAYTTFTSGVGMDMTIYPKDTITYGTGTVTRSSVVSVDGSQYMQISQTGNYNINTYLYTDNAGTNTYTDMSISIWDVNTGVGVGYSGTTISNCCITRDVPVFLCKGVYKVTWRAINSYGFTEEGSTPSNTSRTLTFHYAINSSSPTYKTPYTQSTCFFSKPMVAKDSMIHSTFSIPVSKKMVFSAWVKEGCGDPVNGIPCTASTYVNNLVNLQFNDAGSLVVTLRPSGPIIDGWQRYEGYFTAPATATLMTMSFVNSSNAAIYYDDVRIHPFDANMKSYVYDPISLRLVAELDANNYANFYEYDPEGILIRTKAETKEGIKTINETRSFQQRSIKDVQP